MAADLTSQRIPGVVAQGIRLPTAAAAGTGEGAAAAGRVLCSWGGCKGWWAGPGGGVHGARRALVHAAQLLVGALVLLCLMVQLQQFFSWNMGGKRAQGK
eukprot:scaffold105282_cov21-Tisochrysis_lutea.AAC.1